MEGLSGKSRRLFQLSREEDLGKSSKVQSTAEDVFSEPTSPSTLSPSGSFVYETASLIPPQDNTQHSDRLLSLNKPGLPPSLQGHRRSFSANTPMRLKNLMPHKRGRRKRSLSESDKTSEDGDGMVIAKESGPHDSNGIPTKSEMVCIRSTVYRPADGIGDQMCIVVSQLYKDEGTSALVTGVKTLKKKLQIA